MIQEMAVKMKMTLDEKKVLYKKCKDQYYNDPDGKQLMSDAKFDALEDEIREADPKWKGFKAGSTIKNKKTKVKLPIPMFSLDKVKPATVMNWIQHYLNKPIVLSDKLDGAALEIKYTLGVPTGAFTRGNGIIGGDVSYLVPHLKIPQRVGKETFLVRCEGLFTNAAFNKYKHEFDAARNAASGILNRQDVHTSVKDLSVVVLQVLDPNMQPSKGLAWAKAKGFSVVPYNVFKGAQLTAEKLSKLLAARLAKSKFRMDGLVLTLDSVNPLPKSGNPSWAVAFKQADLDQDVTAVINHIEWEASPHGYLKPVAHVRGKDAASKGVRVGDVIVKKVTLHNAKIVRDKELGPGSVITIRRSGDVIPFLVSVVKSTEASLPSQEDFGAYKWSKKGVDLILVNPVKNEGVRVKIITRFMTSVGVDFFKEGNVRKLYDSGFTNLSKIMRATPEDFLAVPGVKQATADKLHQAIHRALDKGVPVVTLMDASGTFPRGLGSTRFQQIHDRFNMKAVLKSSTTHPERVRQALLSLPGWSDITVSGFLKGAPAFVKWQAVTGIEAIFKKEKAPNAKTQKLKGLVVSWTSYRDKEQEQTVVENGGIVDSFGSKTSVLLYRVSGKQSTKLDKARAKGVPVMTWEQFAKQYSL